MSERTGTCEDCSTTFVAASKGVIPKRCAECYRLHRNRYHQARTAALPPRQRRVQVVTCGDCSSQFDWEIRQGPLPVRCKPCAKERRLASTRERGRVRRAAAKVGDTRRLGVCSECFAEFVGPARGRISQRCPSCTAAWNKVRYKVTASRSETGRRLHLLKKYGMAQEDWDVLFGAQKGRCAICQMPEDEVGRLHVDHCHSSGMIRGLLCQACNTSIGQFREDPEIIRAAAAYVERHRSATVQ